jgi:LPS-assembly protein
MKNAGTASAFSAMGHYPKKSRHYYPARFLCGPANEFRVGNEYPDFRYLYIFKNSNIIAIRHEIRPTISLNYKPDFASKYFYTTQVDTNGHKLRFSQFDGGVIGSFSEGAFGGISFGVDNLLEMKVKDKDTSNKKGKNVKLIDGFGFNSSYNLLADSFALAPFSFYARSTLFEKVNITAGANLDPYDVDSKGLTA